MQHNLKLSSPSQDAAARDNGPVDRRIRAFLSGESHGEDVLAALYGHVANEPVSERFRALLRH